MIRSVLIAGACVIAFGLSAVAQVRAPVQLPEEARRAINEPLLAQITPAARAAIASRLVGRTVAITAISGPAVVTPRAPVFGPETAPLLLLQGRNVHWFTNDERRAPPRISFGQSASPRTGMAVELRYNAERATRYLVLCDMDGQSSLVKAMLGDADAPVTWETPTRGAMLIPPQDRAGVVVLTIYQQNTGGLGRAGELYRCEISAIRM